MKKGKISVKRGEFYSFVLASVLGVVFHFVYDWIGGGRIAGFFFPINESIWEHLKLVFYPVLLVALLEYVLTDWDKQGFWCIKFKSTLVGMTAVTVLFYTYSGIWGEIIDWLNIVIYFIAMILTYGYSCRRLTKDKRPESGNGCFLGIIIVATLFMIFSVYPPSIGFFQVLQ